MTTGEAIKAYRVSLGLTQHEFGDLIGYNSSTVAAWENGLKPLSKSGKEALARLARSYAPPPEPQKRTFPLCFTDEHEYALWLTLARQTKAKSICSDCTPEFQAEMVELGRCEHPDKQPGRDNDLMDGDEVLTGKGL